MQVSIVGTAVSCRLYGSALEQLEYAHDTAPVELSLCQMQCQLGEGNLAVHL